MTNKDHSDIKQISSLCKKTADESKIFIFAIIGKIMPTLIVHQYQMASLFVPNDSFKTLFLSFQP